MLTLEPTKDLQVIVSFLKGEGIRKRCSGGYVNPEEPSTAVANPDNTFLLAKDNDNPVGFVCLFRIMDGKFAMHLVLRTIGQKTKDFVFMGILFAREVLKADAIYAIYPKSARAVEKLCRYFHFRTDASKELAVNQYTPVPYSWEILNLA